MRPLRKPQNMYSGAEQIHRRSQRLPGPPGKELLSPEDFLEEEVSWELFKLWEGYGLFRFPKLDGAFKRCREQEGTGPKEVMSDSP